MLNPLRSEDAAFRLLLWVLGAFLVIVVVIVVVGALG